MDFFASIIKAVKNTLNTVTEEVSAPEDERKGVHVTPSHPKPKRVSSTNKSKKSRWSISDAVDDLTDIL